MRESALFPTGEGEANSAPTLLDPNRGLSQSSMRAETNFLKALSIIFLGYQTMSSSDASLMS